jgi:uncharacterized membrane protein
MIKHEHLRQLGLMYFIASFITAFLMWFEESYYLKALGFTLFFYNLYQIFTEMYFQQQDDNEE